MMSQVMEVTIVGGGMITGDLLLPSIYHLQRTGVVGKINVCARHSTPLRTLKANAEIAAAFPGQDFCAYPSLAESAEIFSPELYREVIAQMPPRQAVVVATPDHLHYEVVLAALQNDQHVLCVKPLVLQYAQALEIEKLALAKGLFVGIEYHKRFDRRSLIARRSYQLGYFGEFILGEAKMIEPYYYRHSNFQNWFTCENSDPFVYVGCHYVDLVNFITGLRPVELSVVGIKGRFPNGNEGYMWATGRVRYENGAILTVTDGLGYPDMGSGTNEQCLTMFFEGEGCTAFLKHDDQFRGVTHSYLEGIGPCGTHHNYINPDFYKLVPWEGAGYKPVGYGYDSVATNILAMQRVENETGLSRQREVLKEIDANGLIATPANSSVNELVTEAARLSILHAGDATRIIYGDHPYVELGKASI